MSRARVKREPSFEEEEESFDTYVPPSPSLAPSTKKNPRKRPLASSVTVARTGGVTTGGSYFHTNIGAAAPAKKPKVDPKPKVAKSVPKMVLGIDFVSPSPPPFPIYFT